MVRTARSVALYLGFWYAIVLLSNSTAIAAAASAAGIQAGALSSSTAPTESAPGQPRLLVLPWQVIDRTTNQIYSAANLPRSTASEEARQLSESGMAALDAVLHRHDGLGELVPRREWQPCWDEGIIGPWACYSSQCASCAPVGELLRYDRGRLRQLGQAVGADYIFLGVTVVPLIAPAGSSPPSRCCLEALTVDKRDVLARTAALLVRVRDGEPVWQRDARRLDRDVLRRTQRPARPPFNGQRPPMPHPRPGPMPEPMAPRARSPWIIFSPAERREMAVDDTAHMLGRAFVRVHGEVMK
jgi:hypothetical protein